jgi:uncharacterized protein (DUF4415 family)
MPVNKRSSKKPWIDPDDGPEFTEAVFRQADYHIGETLVRRGRPPLGNKKVAISARLDADIVEAFRNMGSGWQTRMNKILRDWLKRHPENK